MSHYGSDGGGFNAFSKAYKKNPSIEHYVKLRRENPNAEIEVSVIGGLDQLCFMQPELKKYGIDPYLVASVMDADFDAISKLSLQLLEKMIEARELARKSRTHLARRGLAIPDKLINWLITVALDSLSWNDFPYIPRDLIVLIRERLGGSNPEYEQASKAWHNRMSAAFIGAGLMAAGLKPSFRLISKHFGVAPSTVKRWFPEGDFLKEVGKVLRMGMRQKEIPAKPSLNHPTKGSHKRPARPLRKK